MAFNPDLKRKIVRDRKTGKHHPCVMCGTGYPLPDSVHIVDETEWKAKIGCDRQSNGIPLCPNCHRVFDEVLRPYLYRALKELGGIPESWKKNNKITVIEEDLGFDEDSPSKQVVGPKRRQRVL